MRLTGRSPKAEVAVAGGDVPGLVMSVMESLLWASWHMDLTQAYDNPA